MHGTLLGCSPATPFRGAAIDSRKVRPGDLFFALPGSSTDGHRFVGPALAAGAAAAVVRHVPAEAGAAALIRVEDPFEALQGLARAVREATPRHLVGLTGSTGKTTTKELLTLLLGRRFRVAKSPGNFNNRLGFPLALLDVPTDTEWMVAEMGMSVPGELGAVSHLARPDVAILLNVRPVHLENFRSLADIAEAKAEILAGLPPTGILIANADDPQVVRVASRHPGRIVWFGFGGGEPAPAVRASDVEALAPPALGHRFRLHWQGDSRLVELPIHGRYNVDNALAAAACALVLGLSFDEIAAGLAAAAPAAGRGEVHSLAGGTTLVDDSYNSNPVAVERALEGAAALPGERRWCVLGDMLELGTGELAFHAAAGRRAAELGFAPIVGVGPLSRSLVAAAEEAGARALWLPDASAAARWAVGEVRPGDVVLVKGSRGVGLDRVVAALRQGATEVQG